MRKGFRAALAATLLAGATVGTVTPAEAHGAGLAIGAGLLGLGVGAAIASDHPHYVEYAPPPPPGYYGYAPPPPAHYGYAPPPGYYGYAPLPPEYVAQCRVGWHWSRYWQQYVQERRCY